MAEGGHSFAPGRHIRTVELQHESAVRRATRPVRSNVAMAGPGDPSQSAPLGVTADNGLVLALYDVATDAQNLVLSPLGSLNGTVTVASDPASAPVAAAQVRATSYVSDPLLPTSVSTPTDSAGGYHFQLPPGRTDIMLAAAGFEAYTATVAVESALP